MSFPFPGPFPGSTNRYRGLIQAPVLSVLTNGPLPTFQIIGPPSQRVGDVYHLLRSSDNFATFEEATATVTDLDPPTMTQFDWGDEWPDLAFKVKCYFIRTGFSSPFSNTVPCSPLLYWNCGIVETGYVENDNICAA